MPGAAFGLPLHSFHFQKMKNFQFLKAASCMWRSFYYDGDSRFFSLTREEGDYIMNIVHVEVVG